MSLVATSFFTAEHEALRTTIRAFVERELAPHAEEWETEGNFPDWVFERMGDAGLLGLSYPEQYGGSGGDYISTLVLKEEMARCGSGGVGMALAVQTDMATPPIFKLGMHSSDTAEVVMEDMRLPEEALLGEEGKGFYQIMWELQGERLVAAAGAVAGSQLLFERCLQYAKERQAFGQPIGKFQTMAHRLAEMATEIHAARELVYDAVWKFNKGEYPVKEISMCKLYTGIVCSKIANQAMQIFGGAAYL